MRIVLWSVMVLGACGHKKPDPVRDSPVDNSRPPPGAKGPHLALQCNWDREKPNPCDTFDHPLTVDGDKVEDCYRRPNGPNQESFHLELRATTDPTDTISFHLNNFSSGQTSYNLDDPSGRYLMVSGTEQVERCVEDTRTEMRAMGITARSPGNDASCDSGGCTAQITSVPNQPDRFTIQVECPELCEDGTFIVCKPRSGGLIRFQTTAACALR